MTGSQQSPGGQSPMAMLGIGLDLAVPVALFGLIGHWLDRKWGTTPWLSVLGLLLGMTMGFYNVWKRVSRPKDDGKAK